MSLNKIELRPQMLADLYAKTLVENSTTSVPDSGPRKFLGNNEKQILILVAHSDFPIIPDHELAFLTSILSACSMSLADVTIANYLKIRTDKTFEEFHQNARSVLLFGLDPLSIGLPINFPYFQLQQFNKRTYLYAPSLTELEKDKKMKTNLWNSLKTLFGV